jgi:hypothetical protein
MLDDFGISRIALFTGAELRAVAESFPSRQLQITPRGEVQIGLQPTRVEPHEPDERIANGEAERHLNWRQAALEPTSGVNP